MANRNDFHIEMRSDPKLLCGVRGLMRSCLQQYGLTSDRIQEIVLAVDEACTNALRHSYANDLEQAVTIDLTNDGTSVEIRLRDEGRPAPKDAVRKKPPEPPNLDDLVPGGLGVQLIHAVFDEVDFCPGETQGNCVTMRLRLPDAVEGNHGDTA